MDEKYLPAQLSEGQTHKLDDVFALVDRLPAEDRLQLIRHMLGGFPEDIGNNRLSPSVARQINRMDEPALGDVLREIAGRLTTQVEVPLRGN